MKTSRIILGRNQAGTNDRGDKPSCRVGGHDFVQHGNAWIDTTVESMPHAKRIKVRFDSREFFEVVAKYPKALSLALAAKNIQIAVDDTVYEIYE